MYKRQVRNGENSKYKNWFYHLQFPVERPEDPETLSLIHISLAFVQTVVVVAAELSSPVAKAGIAVSALHRTAQRAVFMRLW